eukprot:GFUD01042063.1.p1 GENE.GFUD01042063.1~~GFUD01042063.1.p1  ORF type:complete len:673 (-),score=271.16 GFUD01042063.1:98-2116(-)
MGNIVSYFRAKPESAAAVELLKVSEVPVDTVSVDTVPVKRETVDEKLTTDNVVEEKELEVVEEAKEIILPVLDDNFEVNLLNQIISEAIQEDKVLDSNQTFNTPEENVEKGSIATEEENQELAPATPFVENVCSLKDDNTSVIANKELTLEALKDVNEEPSTETERCESDVEVIGSIEEQADPEVDEPMPTQETLDPADVELIESLQDAESSKPTSPGPEEVESRPEPVKDEAEIIDSPQSDPKSEKQAIVELPEEQTIERVEDVHVEIVSDEPVRMSTPEKIPEIIEDVNGIEVISSIQDIESAESVRVPTPEVEHEEISESIEDVDGVEVISSITDIESVRVPTPEIMYEELSERIEDVDGIEVVSSIQGIESVRLPTPEIMHEELSETIENVPSIEVIGSIQDIESAEPVRSQTPEKASAAVSEIVNNSLNESIQESVILKPEPNKVELDVEELELEQEQTSETVPEQNSETVPEQTSESVPEQTPETVTEQTSETVTEQTSETVPEKTPETVPEQTSETVTEQTGIQETSSEPTEAVPEVEMIGSIQVSDSELVNLENIEAFSTPEAVKTPSSDIVKEQTTEPTTSEPIESIKALSPTSETKVHDDEVEDQNPKGGKSLIDSVNDRDVIKEDTNEANKKEVGDMQTVSGGVKGVKDLLDDSSNSDEEY